MFKIANSANLVLASSSDLTKFVEASKVHRFWKKEEGAQKFISKLNDAGINDVRIVELGEIENDFFVEVFKIKNVNGEFLASLNNFEKWTSDISEACFWKKENGAKKVLASLEFVGITSCEIFFTGEIVPTSKKASFKTSTSHKKSEHIDEPIEEEIDENILFNEGFADKCTRCEKSCKQPKVCTILKCPDFVKIKK